jgi:hypothetical protein
MHKPKSQAQPSDYIELPQEWGFMSDMLEGDMLSQPQESLRELLGAAIMRRLQGITGTLFANQSGEKPSQRSLKQSSAVK